MIERTWGDVIFRFHHPQTVEILDWMTYRPVFTKEMPCPADPYRFCLHTLQVLARAETRGGRFFVLERMVNSMPLGPEDWRLT